jgi:predicted nucleotidyltransferase
MRLSEHQRDVILRSTAELAGASAKALLFGSRLDDQARGGDIDILIELPQPCPDRLALSLRIGARIERQLGLQKIDVLVADPTTPLSAVLRVARSVATPI